MPVFKLQSDNQFIRTNVGSSDIHVYEYMDDLNTFDLIHVSTSRWSEPIRVGPSAAARFNRLKVHGVTIGGSQLAELVKDLTWVDVPNCRRFFPMVNRQGLCLMHVGCQQAKRVRINDHFGWSKYGVKVPSVIGGSATWSRWDMNNGVVLDGDKCSFTNEMWKKVVEEMDKVIEEKDKLMEKTESLLRKKEKEVVSLKAALKTLITD